MAKSKPHKQDIGKLRIIGGEWRGRKLEFANLPGLRPTPDRIRETLFNWLAPRINGARCLDLYCGSGALGFECLSRGAAEVTMVDAASAVQQSISRNNVLLACDNAKFVRADVLDWLNQTKFNTSYDIVFVDPPYELPLLEPTLAALRHSDAISQVSWIYTEAPRKFAVPAPPEWDLHRDKQAGNNRYCLFSVQKHAITARVSRGD
ncbi:MAG: 16S rRNA (guanine(966)-N(2))-methyltransferase RsmD [Pseudomonadales bacterium]